MYCPRCGAQTVPGSAFCVACGNAVAQVVAGDVLKRPGIVTVLAVLQFIGAGFCLLAAFAILTLGPLGSETPEAPEAIIGAMFGAVGLTQLMCGIGLWTLKPYGRILQMVLAWIGLLGIPVGTIISILILVYMFKPGIKTLFSGRPAQDLTPQELAQVAAATQGSAAATAVVVVVVVLISVAVIGIVAAIAIPGLLRARMVANEASAIAGIRNLISAEVSYSVANGGFPDVPDCLVNPAKCQPAYSGPPLLDAPYASTLPRSGYVFQFHPGASIDPDTIKTRGLSPTSLVGFAYTAEPDKPGVSGMRSFCGDDTGVVCWVNSAAPTPVGGGCPPRCQPVR